VTRKITAPIDRFTPKWLISKTHSYEGTPCWEWQANKLYNGYGSFWVKKGKDVCAHRWSYEHYVGPIPTGYHVDHLCRNISCVNPDHLEPVTPIVNAQRAAKTWKSLTHCKRGHEFIEENTYTSPNGRKHCRSCRKVSEATQRAKGPRDRAKEIERGKVKKTICKHGHMFTEENTYVKTNGARQCRECTRMLGRKRYQRLYKKVA